MSRRLGSVPLFFMFCIASQAGAADWVLVSRPFARQRVSVDRSTITRNGNVTTIWTRVGSPPPMPGSAEAALVPSNAASPDVIDGGLYLMQIACSSRMIRVSTATVAAQSTNPFGPANLSPYTFQPINTAVGYAVMGAACTKTEPAAVTFDPDEARRNITPRRTSQHKNPWSYTKALAN